MNFQDLGVWLEIFAAVGGVLGAVASAATWLARHSLVTHRDLATAMRPLADRAEATERRVLAVEVAVEHLPHVADMTALQTQISSLQVRSEQIATGLQGVRDILERIERPLNVLVDSHMKGGAE